MSSYFDEQAVQQRVTRRYRRRFVLATHTILTLFFMAGSLVYGLAVQAGLRDAGLEALSMGQLALHYILIFGLVLLPLVLHGMYVFYRDQVERAITRELQASDARRIYPGAEKRKMEASTADWQQAGIRLTDDGEWLYDEDAGDTDGDDEAQPVHRQQRQ